jgi:hypothetical protein
MLPIFADNEGIINSCEFTAVDECMDGSGRQTHAEGKYSKEHEGSPAFYRTSNCRSCLTYFALQQYESSQFMLAIFERIISCSMTN